MQYGVAKLQLFGSYQHNAMAEVGEGPSGSPQKSLKRSALLSKQTAEACAINFQTTSEGGLLFCKYCDHCMDYIRVDTIKDHIRSI